MFGSDHYGIRPDIITIAKGLTSAYAPLSGSIVGEQASGKCWRRAPTRTARSATAGPTPPTRSAPPPAIANLRLVDSLGLVANAGATGAYLNAALKDALGGHPNVGDVRGEGMLAAVEFVEDRRACRFFDPSRKVGPAVAAALLSRGVIARAMPQGDILGFAPPLCLTRAEADTIVAATAGAVAEVLG